MSFNIEPEWAPLDTSAIENIACPHCQEKFGNYEEVTEVLFNNTYYTARHIPKKLIFTCFNPDCTHVDEDFIINLKTVIHVVE